MQGEVDVVQVQVAYVDHTGQYLVDVACTTGMTARQVLEASGLLAQLPEGQALVVGIYGHKIDDLERYLPQQGDRLEIYRPLTRDPMAVRRKRAEAYPVGRRIKKR